MMRFVMRCLIISSQPQPQVRYVGAVKFLGLVVVLAACGFKSSPAQGTPPDGNAGGGGIDASTPDAHVDAPVQAIDAQLCFGKGVVEVCLKAAPTTDKTFTATNFNTDGTSCIETFPQTNGPDLCVVAYKNLTVSGTVTATGSRALVLLGTETVTISDNGTVDASSRTANPTRHGAASNFASCPAVTHATSDSGGAGGGAGGSFGTVGGNGGLGDMNDNGAPDGQAPGAVAAAAATPSVLRGGCPGGAGGSGSGQANQAGGDGGDGGGAVYVIAGKTITIAGNVFASGAGGHADGNVVGSEEGGGGGGAGGMIGLDAPALNITGKVVANGGGGGGGGTTDRGGTAGGDGTTTSWNAQADHGNAGNNPQTGSGGDGARGATINATTNLDGMDTNGGGGGGGGGLGVIAVWGTITGGTMMSPAPVTH
jgi:hypothetical protein